MARFSMETIHRLVFHSRSYWLTPTHFNFGSSLEPVNDYFTVKRGPPRKTTEAVRIIGIAAIFAFKFRKS